MSSYGNKVFASVFLLLLSYDLNGAYAKPDAEVLKDVTIGFGKMLEECRVENNLTPEMMEEFHHIWNPEFELIHREIGCTVICMSHKFQLLDERIRMHHQNMDEFIKSFPQGEKLAKIMIEMIHGCEKTFDDLEDHCTRTLEILKCFRSTATAAGINPSFELIEIL